MKFDLDMSELRSFSRQLAKAGPELKPRVDKLLRTEVERAAVEARAAAPKDRPWLSTEEGLRVEQKSPLTWSIVSPPDPRGQSVGYRVVYGTSTQAPNDFITGPLVAAGNRFNRQAMQMLIRDGL